MLSYRISHSGDKLDIRPHIKGLDLAKRGFDIVYWHRDGMVGKLPWAIVAACITLYKSYVEMQKRGRLVDIPAAVYEIEWDQCQSVERDRDEFRDPPAADSRSAEHNPR